MVTYASGSTRITGLTSQSTGFDTMIQNLLKIEGRQATKLLQWKSDWQTRLDAFKSIRGELINLQTALNGLNSMNKFLVKAASSSDEKLISASATSDAMNSNYEVKTGQLATYSTWTKNIGLSDKNQVIAEEKGSITYSYKGTYRTLTVPKGTTVEGLTKIINNDSKNPGIKAQLVQSTDGISLQLRGMDTGKSNALVLRSTTNITGLDVQLDSTASKYTDTENSATLTQPFASLTDKLHTDDQAKTFVYTVDGNRHTIEVTKDDDIQSLVQKINQKTPGIASITLDPSQNNYIFKLEKADTVFDVQWDSDSPTTPGTLGQILGVSSQNVDPMSFSSQNDILADLGVATGEFKFTVFSSDGTQPNNKEYSVTIDSDTTLRSLANSLQYQIGSNGTVAIKADPNNAGKYILAVEMKDKTHRLTVEDGTLEQLSYEPPMPVGDDWIVVNAQNAQVQINGVPKDGWMEVANNTLQAGEVIPGVSFTLKKANSEATISVSNDTEQMTENIIAFLDAVNSFRTVLKSFTSYDESKDTLDTDYAESQFEMQKGGVLMGNYGVQLIESRLKSAIAGASLGFLSRQYSSSGTIIGGDVFSSLSQIGIKTNANEGELMYGMLEINSIPDNLGSKTLEQALAEDPEAVARLFATKSEGKSNSDYFHYDSHIPSLTKSGTYNVSYTMSADGSGIASASINGAACSIDQENGIITCTEGVAKGLSIKIGENDPMQTYTGTVSIKDGKVNELLGLLDGAEGMLGSNGTLRTLEKNYQSIIDGIEDKIKREDERLQRFENTMIQKFARLEEVISKYDGIQNTLDQLLTQMNNNSK